MKNLKYFLVGAMMTVITAPVMAQGDASTIGLQVSNIIKSKAPDADKQIKALAKPFKKDAKALAQIGRAYMDAKDFTNANLYAEQAIKANKNCADGYVLKGDIFVIQDDGGQASSWYEQAIYFDPKDPAGYRKYAVINSKTSPTAAKEKLEALRTNCPDYPVDIVAAEMMMNVGKTDQAIEYYKKADRAKMSDDQLTNFALAMLTKGDIDGCLEVATYGHNKSPRYGAFNRLMLYNNTDKKNFDEALKAGDLLFNQSDSVAFKNLDYSYMARALEGAGQFDKAVEYYEKYQGLDGVSNDEKNAINKNISDAYAGQANWAKAHEYLDKYIKGIGKTAASLEEAVANLYVKEMTDSRSTPEQKKAAYEKADAQYALIATDFPDNAVYVANKRGNLAFQTEGDDMAKLKLAGPRFVELAALIEAKEAPSTGEQKVLKTAYNYLIPYYVHCQEDLPKAKEIANKLIVLDPENANAKAIISLK